MLYRDFDEGKSVYSGDWSKESIVDFVKSNSIPMITKVDHEDLKQYSSYLPIENYFLLVMDS